MKKYQVFFLLVLVLGFFIWQSCRKSSTSVDSAIGEAQSELSKIERYKIGTKKEISRKSRSISTIESDDCPTITAEDLDSTFEYNIFYQPEGEEPQLEHTVYITPIYRETGKIGYMLGYVSSQNTILNAIFVGVDSTEEYKGADVFTVDRMKLGGFRTFRHDVYRTFEEPLPFDYDETFIQQRSWWACTKDCISDAHIACFMDEHCATMLLLVNVTSRFGTPSFWGAGSMSISAACGIVCAKNTNLDMLPEY